MAYESFDFTVADKVGHIRFNRPDKRNSMTLAFWHDMRAVFAEIEDRDDVRAVVISSTGPHFTAGMDLSVFGSLTPPKTILNAPTKLMKQEGYGADYAYDHDAPDAFSGQNYWPDALGRQRFYDPPERGFEREIRKRLEYWEKLRQERGE